MSKKNELKEEMVDFQNNNVSQVPLQETLSAQDTSVLEIAKLNRKVALKEAEKALAQNEAAELSFKYVVLQLYIKYKLDIANDALTEDGKIMRGALQQGAKL
jgi:hypothetical protein